MVLRFIFKTCSPHLELTSSKVGELFFIVFGLSCLGAIYQVKNNWQHIIFMVIYQDIQLSGQACVIFTFVIRVLIELVGLAVHFFFFEDNILSVRIYEVYNFEMCQISILQRSSVWSKGEALLCLRVLISWGRCQPNARHPAGILKMLVSK